MTFHVKSLNAGGYLLMVELPGFPLVQHRVEGLRDLGDRIWGTLKQWAIEDQRKKHPQAGPHVLYSEGFEERPWNAGKNHDHR